MSASVGRAMGTMTGIMEVASQLPMLKSTMEKDLQVFFF
jgi:hypothetical protein